MRPKPYREGVRAYIGDLARALDDEPPYEFAEALLRHLRQVAEATACTILLADYEERTLMPVPGQGNSSTDGEQLLEGSVAGQAYLEQAAIVVPAAGVGYVGYFPVTMRAERLGVLEVDLPDDDPALRVALSDIARFMGYAIVAARRYTDRFERIRRRRALDLAAEIQWELLPVLAYDAPEFSIAGSLEPAYEIGGDTFDYAVAEETLTVSVTDAMGHGLRAAMLGSLAVTSLRNRRRQGDGVVQQVEQASERLSEQFGGEQYVTGVILLADLATGAAVVVNAGHPLPMLLREGRVGRIELDPDPPMGMFPGNVYRPDHLALQPGDRLLLFSDGLTDARPDGGQAFGEEHLAERVLQTADLSAAEVVRLLTSAVLDHRAGQLADDATAVCLDWRG
ncbi:MAG: serine/threonine-protein phosphatase [Actinomycetota bacterium]|nr:serine/threonine-protein phosphatase [Actinomycetota bacterium]